MGEDHIMIIIFNLLSSVKFLHESNIIHRDIKPANILINHNCNVKLCDFGISRSIIAPVNGVSKPNLSENTASTE